MTLVFLFLIQFKSSITELFFLFFRRKTIKLWNH